MNYDQATMCFKAFEKLAEAEQAVRDAQMRLQITGLELAEAKEMRKK